MQSAQKLKSILEKIEKFTESEQDAIYLIATGMKISDDLNKKEDQKNADA